MMNVLNKWRKKCDRGTASLEFALLLPLMLLILLGLFDVTELFYCKIKMQRIAIDLNNIIARGDLTRPELQAIMMTAEIIGQPFDFTDSGNVIVTSVTKPSNNSASPSVSWQDSWPGGTGESRVDPSSLPGGLVLSNGQTVIFTEVFYDYTPLFPAFSIQEPTRKVYTISVSIPREGQMTSLPQN